MKKLLMFLGKEVGRLFEQLPYLLVALFVVVNLYELTSGSAGAFQRLGSLWAALAIGLLASHRAFWEFMPNVLKNSTVKDVAVKTINDQTHVEVSEGQFDEMIDQLEVVAEKRIARSRLVEVLVLIAATLQWGYGDIVHCWYHGNGWGVCY